MRCKSWDFLFYIGFKRAGKCLVFALLPQKLPLVCLAVCLTPDARRDALRAKQKPVRRVPGGLLLSLCPLLCKSKYRPVATKPHGLHLLGSAFPKPCHCSRWGWVAIVMHSGQWASLFQSWQGNCRPCGRHPPRCSSPPRGPQPLPMSDSGQSADGRSDTGVRPESWSKR